VDVEIRGSVVAGEHDLVVTRPWHNPWVISSLTEHDLRDLEFALAQRRAVSRRCPETDGEHTCGNSPGHPVSEQYDLKHLCRACTHRWIHSGRPEDTP
jgi:hypothetical protein